jgi:hypothetical protein
MRVFHLLEDLEFRLANYKKELTQNFRLYHFQKMICLTLAGKALRD